MDFLTGVAPEFNTHPLNPCAGVWTGNSGARPPRPPFADVWTAVHDGWPLGLTFPAVLGGNSNDPSRPDRILLRGAGAHACTADRIGPEGGQVLSDHFGVEVALALY